MFVVLLCECLIVLKKLIIKKILKMEEEDENDHFFDQLATGHDFDLIKVILFSSFLSFMNFI